MLRPYISQPCRYRRSFLDPHREWDARMPRPSCLLLAIAVLVPRPALAQSGVVTLSDNLLTDGLPPVPAAIAEAARPYSELRAAAFSDWHPTRREMTNGTRLG